MDDFDKEFNRDLKRIRRAFWTMFVFYILLSVLALGGIGWLVYVLLKHFGIVG